MSLHLEFEPHSWYFGHAIKKNDSNGSDKWESVYYDGIKGRFVERNAFTLKNLKQQIKAYENNYYHKGTA